MDLAPPNAPSMFCLEIKRYETPNLFHYHSPAVVECFFDSIRKPMPGRGCSRESWIRYMDQTWCRRRETL